MFHEPYLIFEILLLSLVLYVWNFWRYDVVALLSLGLAILVGAVPFSKAYSGLNNSAVITVACVMIISEAIRQSGVLNHVTQALNKKGRSPWVSITFLFVSTAVLSGFMNNIGALALMMPVAIRLAERHRLPPSILLMPLAFASAFGGLTTLIGTPANLLISSYRATLTSQPFSMFDFSYTGVPVAIFGVVFLLLIGWRLLPMPKNHKKSTDTHIDSYFAELQVNAKSSFLDMTVAELKKIFADDATFVSLVRNNRRKNNLSSKDTIQTDDVLIIKASAIRLKEIQQQGSLEWLDETISPNFFHSEDITTCEAIVAPGSNIERRSAKQLKLRERYHVQLLALSRHGQDLRNRLHQVTLRTGDAILMQGRANQLEDVMSQLKLMPLGAKLQHTAQKTTWLPLCLFLLAIVATAMGWIPVDIAFSGCILLMILFKLIPVRDLYTHIDWSVIILLAAMIPLGTSLQTTGGTQWIAQHLLVLTPYVSPVFLISLILFITMLLSDFMNNAATAVVMAPIAATVAQTMHAHINPFLMAVAIGTSCAFSTPIGHQNNLLILGPGNYRFTDYILLGLPLQLVVIAMSAPLICWIWPLY